MNLVRRAIVVAALVATGGSALIAPASAATTKTTGGSPVATTSSLSRTVAGVPCTKVTELGTKKVVADLGMSAFTVRQYKGYCRDAKGSAWMNFASVYVWQQYHARGFAYSAVAALSLTPSSDDVWGLVVGGNRQRLTYSTPERTITRCTQGLGRIVRPVNVESAIGLTSNVC